MLSIGDSALHVSILRTQAVEQSPVFATALGIGAISTSGFYANRLRQSEILEMAAGVGFEVEVTAEHHRPALPISRRRLHPMSRDFPDVDLAELRHATTSRQETVSRVRLG